MKLRTFLLALFSLTVPVIAQTPAPTSHPLASQLNDAFAGVFEKVAPAVVVIKVQATADVALQGLPEGLEFYFRGPDGRPMPVRPTEGSGFIISPDGYIMTNYHVVESGVTGEISVRLQDGRAFPAAVIGADRKSDIAVIKIDAKDLPTVELGDSDKARVGHFAFAIGAPYDLPYTFTAGVISAKGRDDLPTEIYQEFLQTDAAIHPGNSGGPLCDLDGKVVGVNTMINGINRGLGFAVPINLARDVASQLMTNGRVSRPWLGIGILGLEESAAARAHFPGLESGVLVRGIQEDTPAFNSDLQAGDVILKIDGKAVGRSRDLQREILSKAIGEAVEVEYWRQGRISTLSISTGEQPEKFIRTAARSRSESGPESRQAPSGDFHGMQLEESASKSAGVRVAEVAPDSAAAAAGVRAGDVIVDVAGQAITTRQGLEAALAKGDSRRGVLILIDRGGQKTFAILKD
jgi:serine protease Do